MSFGDRFKKRREELGFTLMVVAEKLGVTKGAVGNYETGFSSPKADILFKVFDVLHCDANYLFQDEMATTKHHLNTVKDGGLIQLEISYQLLNEVGRAKVDAYINDLLVNPKYQATKEDVLAFIEKENFLFVEPDMESFFKRIRSRDKTAFSQSKSKEK